MFIDLSSSIFWHEMQLIADSYDVPSCVSVGPWPGPPRKCAHYAFCGNLVPIPLGWPLCELCSYFPSHFEGSFVGPHSCDGCFPGIVHILDSSAAVRYAVAERLRIEIGPPTISRICGYHPHNLPR